MVRLKRRLIDAEQAPSQLQTEMPKASSTTVKRLNSQVPIFTKHQIQPYRKIKRVGKGRHSICYQIIHPNGNTYAMKTLPINDPKFKNSQRSRIINEIQIHKLLSKYNNIATYFEDFQFENEYIAIIMDYYPNGSLDKYINNGVQLREWEVRRSMIQLLGGVYWIHKNNIVHGDLKLGNLLLDESFNLKICDFGHSFNNKHNQIYTRNFINSNTFSSMGNKIIGTPNYLAPELISKIIKNDTNDNLISFEIDIWAIGIILYILIVGVAPFQDLTLDMMCHRIQDCSFEFPISNSNNFEISKEVKTLISSILRKHPLERLSVPEIVAHKWFQSYFPASLNINDSLNLDSYENSTMNLQSMLNFKNCLVDSGLTNLLKNNDEDRVVSHKTTKENSIEYSLASPKKDETNNLSFINQTKSVSFAKLSMYIRNLEANAESRRVERVNSIKQFQPPTVKHSNIIHYEISKHILMSHYQKTLEKMLECEQLLKMSSKLCSENSNSENQQKLTYVIRKEIDQGPGQNSFIYQLSNGDIGMLFSNGHSLLKLMSLNAIWYIVPDEQNGWISKCFDCTDLPNELQDKLNYVEDVASKTLHNSDIQNNNAFDIDMNGLSQKESDSEDVFVRNITFYENNEISMIELSDGTIQFDFKENECAIPLILSISDYGDNITLISKIEGIRTMTMLDFMQRFEHDKSSSHIKDKLMIMKNCLRAKLNC